MWPRGREARLAALCVLLPASLASAQGAFFEGGLLVARGDYVYTQRTSSASFSAGVGLTTGRLTLRATLPFFVRDTRLLESKGTPPLAQAPTSTAASYAGGLTDPFVQAYVNLLPAGRTALGLGVSSKIPVVAQGAFGTGRWDYGGALSLSRVFGSASLVGLDFSFWHLGDLPDFELNDTVTGTLTLGRGLGGSWSASASLSGSRSAVPGYDDPWWLGLLVGRGSSRGMWGVTLSIGLTPTAPDLSAGLVWRVGLGG